MKEVDLAKERAVVNCLFIALMEQLETINTETHKNYKQDVKHVEKRDLKLFKKIGYKLFKDVEDESEKKSIRRIVDFYHESSDIVRKNIVIEK